MAIHLCLPREVLYRRVVVLMAFHVEEIEAKRQAFQDLGDSAFQVVLGGQAVVRIEPLSGEMGFDALQESQVIAVEEMFNCVLDDDVKELQVEIEKDQDRKKPVGFGSEGAGFKAECRAFTLPENDPAYGELPSEGS